MSQNTMDTPPQRPQSLAHEALGPLCVENGQSVPVEGIPFAGFDLFSHWLTGEVHRGGRVAAFFALPGAEKDCFRLVAVLAMDSCGKLFLAGTETGPRYASLTPRIPSLHLFERELHEKYGIVPEGHPWLKPVRFEHADGPEAGMVDFYTVAGDEVHEVAVGPIHAGIIECGHFRFQCLGEVVMHLEISLGYHHRGVERMVLQSPGPRTLGLMETLCGDSTIAHSWAYCANMEALSAAPAPPRAQLLRALALELERLANHTGDLGAIAGDVGFLPTLNFCGRLRGDWLNMSAELCGSRFGRGMLRPGGTCFDVDDALIDALMRRLEATHKDVQGAARLLWDSPSVMARLTGIGRVAKRDAQTLGMVGMAARASGLARDARRFHPLPYLPAPPETAVFTSGDVLARTNVRTEEIETSVAYCKRLLGEFLRRGEGSTVHCEQAVRPAPNRVVVTLVEGWRGEICHVAVTDDSGRLAAYQVVDPSFHNWMGLALALRPFLRPGGVLSHGQADPLARHVDLHHPDLHHVAGLHHLVRVLHEAVGERRNVDQPVLMDADVHEGAEGRDVGHHPLEHHAGLEVGDLLDARRKGCGLERRTRVAAWLLEFGDDVGDRRHTELFVGEIHRFQVTQRAAVAHQVFKRLLSRGQDALNYRVRFRVNGRGIQRVIAVVDA